MVASFTERLSHMLPGSTLYQAVNGGPYDIKLDSKVGFGNAFGIKTAYLSDLIFGEFSRAMINATARPTLGCSISVVVSSCTKKQASFVIYTLRCIAVVESVQPILRSNKMSISPDVGPSHSWSAAGKVSSIPEAAITSVIDSPRPQPARLGFLNLYPKTIFNRDDQSSQRLGEGVAIGMLPVPVVVLDTHTERTSGVTASAQPLHEDRLSAW